MPNRSDEDLLSIVGENSSPSENEVSEQDKFEFAKEILFALAGIFILSSVCYTINDQSKIVFEFVKQIVPQIVMLILGYYFAKK